MMFNPLTSRSASFWVWEMYIKKLGTTGTSFKEREKYFFVTQEIFIFRELWAFKPE